MTLPPPVKLKNLAEMLDRLGRVPPERIRVQPPMGTATEADLLRPENRFCELIDGILVEKAPVSILGWALTGVLIQELARFVYSQRLGLVGPPDLMARMVDGNVRLPDISFYSWSRVPGGRPGPERFVPGAPDLAVEVMSDSNTAEEMQRKREEFFASGCRLVWEVEPELRLVRVYTDATTFTTVTIDQTLTGDPVLPGFAVLLRALFDSLEPPPVQGTTP
jgi:Uma2 family endonuclease